MSPVGFISSPRVICIVPSISVWGSGVIFLTFKVMSLCRSFKDEWLVGISKMILARHCQKHQNVGESTFLKLALAK